MLADKDHELAWQTAATAAEDIVGPDQWLRLAEAREADHPADAVLVYQRVVEHVLATTDRRAYQQAVRILKRAGAAARAAEQTDTFVVYLAELRERHRPTPDPDRTPRQGGAHLKRGRRAPHP